MPVGAMIFLGIVLVVFTALDIIMLASLSAPGDERNQTIVWKASSFTLLATTGGMEMCIRDRFTLMDRLHKNCHRSFLLLIPMVSLKKLK